MDCDSCSSGSCDSGCCGPRSELPPGMLQQYKLSTSRADGYLVWVEVVRRDGRLCVSETTERLLRMVASINDGSRIWGVVFGYRELKRLYPRLFGLGVETLYEVHSSDMSMYLPEEYAGAISSIAKRIEPATILFPSDGFGYELAGRVAGILGAGIVGRCTDLVADGRSIMAVSEIGRFAFRDFPQIVVSCGSREPIGNVANGTGTVIYWNHRCRFDKKILEVTLRS